jgi:hypothetical protein
MKHLNNALLATLPNYIGSWANDCGVEPVARAFE